MGSAFAAPVVINHTSVARRIVGNVSETRVGGGFGQSRTATTDRDVSYTAGECGKIDAVWPSSPTPSRHTSNDDTSFNSTAYASAARSGSSPKSPSDGAIGWTLAGATGTWSSNAARACVSLRSGSPAGRNRSSPQ